MNKRLVKKEITLLHLLLIGTSKLIMGIGLGLIIAAKFWYLPMHFHTFGLPLIILGGVVLLLTLYFLMELEVKEETELEHELKTDKKAKFKQTRNKK